MVSFPGCGWRNGRDDRPRQLPAAWWVCAWVSTPPKTSAIALWSPILFSCRLPVSAAGDSTRPGGDGQDSDGAPAQAPEVTPPYRPRARHPRWRADESHAKAVRRRPSILESDPRRGIPTSSSLSILLCATVMESLDPPGWAGARWIGAADLRALAHYTHLRLQNSVGYDRARLLVPEGRSVRAFVEVDAPAGSSAAAHSRRPLLHCRPRVRIASRAGK
jgi:hypothetical protein